MQHSSLTIPAKKTGLKSLLKAFAFTSAATLATLALGTTQAQASQWFISGDTVYYTGGTEARDPETLREIMNAAALQGVTIRRVVLRNGPGGAAVGGTGMGEAIREFGLDTVQDGGCYSACTAAYVGGVNRFFTNYDLPSLSYDIATFGIHGASSGGVPVSDAAQQRYIDHYRAMLGEEVWAIAGDRITYAHTELATDQGFLFYLDPNSTEPAIFCPSADRSDLSQCIQYPNVTLVSDGIATSGDYVTTNDRLYITDTVNAPITTGMETTTWYQSSFDFLADEGPLDSFTGINRTEAPTFGDRVSTVAVTPGGHWMLDSEVTAPWVIVDGGKLTLGANSKMYDVEGIGIRNRGIMALTGGNVSGTTLVDSGGLLTGRGSIGATVLFTGGNFMPHDMVLRPYTETPLAANGLFASLRDTPLRLAFGRVTTLAEESNMILTVSSDQTNAPVTLEQARYFTTTVAPHLFEIDFGDFILPFVFNADQLTVSHRKAVLSISNESRLLLNFNPGHYTADQRLNLVQGRIDDTILARPNAICNATDTPLYCDLLTPGELSKPAEVMDFITGRFTTAGLFGDPDSMVDASEDGAIIHARKNSLLTFSLFQNANEIYLVANPAFEDVGLFGNDRSGNELGEALRTASYDSDTRLGPVLGALQFADRDVARAQAGAIRGDGHASLRLIGRSVVDQFSDALFGATRQRGTQGVNSPAAMASAMSLPGDQEGRMGMGGGYVGSAMVTQPAQVVERSPYDLSTPTQFWVTGFGQTGKLDGQDRISEVQYNGYGTMIGAARSLSENARIGAAVGYGRINANTRPANSFNAEVETIIGAVYGDLNYSRGYVSGQVGYGQLTNDTRRNILDIEGLEGTSEADYDSEVLFARLEHGFALADRGGAKLTLLAPVVDYINIKSGDFSETGPSPANLNGEVQDLESFRAGLGLQIERNLTRGNWGATPYARVVWQQEFSDRDATSINRFGLAPGLPFDAVSRQLGENAVEWNLGLRSTTLNENLSLSVEYQGQATKGEDRHAVQVGLSYRF